MDIICTLKTKGFYKYEVSYGTHIGVMLMTSMKGNLKLPKLHMGVNASGLSSY